jgi:hypothetical protein
MSAAVTANAKPMPICGVIRNGERARARGSTIQFFPSSARPFLWGK